MRIYNPSLGRFLSTDPLQKSYPWYTPYQFAGNKPIWAVDLDGEEESISNTIFKFFFGSPGSSSNPKTALDYMSKERTEAQATYSSLKVYANYLYYSNRNSSVPIYRLTEKQKEAEFMTNTNATVAILMYEFATGTGKAIRDFDERHALTQSLKMSLATYEALNEAIDAKKNGSLTKEKMFPYKFSSSPDQVSLREAIGKHIWGITMEGNSALFSRGGLQYQFKLDENGDYDVTILDQYSLDSYLRTGTAPERNEGGSATPFGTTFIRVHFKIKKDDIKKINENMEAKKKTQVRNRKQRFRSSD